MEFNKNFYFVVQKTPTSKIHSNIIYVKSNGPFSLCDLHIGVLKTFILYNITQHYTILTPTCGFKFKVETTLQKSDSEVSALILDYIIIVP